MCLSNSFDKKSDLSKLLVTVTFWSLGSRNDGSSHCQIYLETIPEFCSRRIRRCDCYCTKTGRNFRNNLIHTEGGGGRNEHGGRGQLGKQQGLLRGLNG